MSNLKKTISALIIGSMFMTSCSVNLKDAGNRAAELFSQKAETALNPESIKVLAEKVGLGDIGKFDVNLITNGIQIDFGEGTSLVNGIKTYNMDKKLALLLSLLSNVEYVEIKYNNEVIKVDRNSLKEAFGLKLEELSKTKEDLTKFLNDALKR